jgi:hypothetical protein
VCHDVSCHSRLLLENRTATEIDGHSFFLLASFLNGCLNFNRLFDAG